MFRTVIHAGYPKTATTWFVRNFYPRVKNAEIIYYNDIKFDKSPANEHFVINESKLNSDKEIRVIMSHIFSGLVNGCWDNGSYRPFFIKHLKSSFPNAEIVLFIRNQFDFIASLYSSYLKRGCTFSVEKLFTTDLVSEGNIIHFDFLNYVQLLHLFQENFGTENVHVFVYEDLMHDNSLFLRAFVKKLGYRIDVEDISFQKSNESLRSGLAPFIRKSNMLFSYGPKPKKNIVNWPFVYKLINQNADKMNSSSLWGRKMDREALLGKSLSLFIKDYYKESNLQLVRELNLTNLRQYGYPL